MQTLQSNTITSIHNCSSGKPKPSRVLCINVRCIFYLANRCGVNHLDMICLVVLVFECSAIGSTCVEKVEQLQPLPYIRRAAESSKVRNFKGSLPFKWLLSSNLLLHLWLLLSVLRNVFWCTRFDDEIFSVAMFASIPASVIPAFERWLRRVCQDKYRVRSL